MSEGGAFLEDGAASEKALGQGAAGTFRASKDRGEVGEVGVEGGSRRRRKKDRGGPDRMGLRDPCKDFGFYSV